MGKLVLQDNDKVSFECFKVKHQTKLENLMLKTIDVQMSFCDYEIDLTDVNFLNDSLLLNVNVFATRLIIKLPKNSKVNTCINKSKRKSVYSLINEEMDLVANVEINKRVSKVTIING